MRAFLQTAAQPAWDKVPGLGAFVLAGILALWLLAPPAEASFNFRASFVADKVVRLWFHKQDGIQVWNILKKLNKSRTRQLWEKVAVHPYVVEVTEGLHGPRPLQLYYGLQQTFADHMHYK